MKMRLIRKSVSGHPGYGAGCGDTEWYEYECPCGKGRIIEEHDNIPGFREHDVYIECDVCREKYTLDLSNGVRYWKLVEK